MSTCVTRVSWLGPPRANCGCSGASVYPLYSTWQRTGPNQAQHAGAGSGASACSQLCICTTYVPSSSRLPSRAHKFTFADTPSVLRRRSVRAAGVVPAVRAHRPQLSSGQHWAPAGARSSTSAPGTSRRPRLCRQRHPLTHMLKAPSVSASDTVCVR